MHSHFPFAGLLKFVFFYLANTAVLCYSLTIICCCSVQNYIYWLISTENDHRHHHKFIKYEKQLRKEGNMLGLPINNNQAKSLPLPREIWRVALPWVRSIQRQRSNWSLTYILHLFHLEDTSYKKKKREQHRVLSTITCGIDLNIVIQTLILITIVLGLFCQQIVSFAAYSVLIFINNTWNWLIVKHVFKDVIMNVEDKWCVSCCQYSVCNTQKYLYICYSQCVKPVIWLNVQSFGQMPLTARHLAKCLKFPIIWPNDWKWVPSQ